MDFDFRDRYKGEWKDGMMHGKGTFMWSKGDMYEGHWRAGKMHGHGVKKMGNGDVYEGKTCTRDGLEASTGTEHIHSPRQKHEYQQTHTMMASKLVFFAMLCAQFLVGGGFFFLVVVDGGFPAACFPPPLCTYVVHSTLPCVLS